MTNQASSKRAVLIAGPTASGKSALALALADELGGTIINADSMQVYCDLRIITARPTPAEVARAGRWPIVVGGTGLYFKALTQGLTAIPPIPAGIRSAVRHRLEAEGVAPLHAELGERDPATASRLMPGDRARITRALEVVLATGRSLTDWHREGMLPALDPDRAVKIFLDVERSELYRRIDARFDAMLACGPLDEVRALGRRGLDAALPAMKAHGVPWLIRHLNGEIDLAAAAEAGKRDTRRYTKRQATWFRHQLLDWAWVAPDMAPGEIARALGR